MPMNSVAAAYLGSGLFFAFAFFKREGVLGHPVDYLMALGIMLFWWPILLIACMLPEDYFNP